MSFSDALTSTYPSPATWKKVTFDTTIVNGLTNRSTTSLFDTVNLNSNALTGVSSINGIPVPISGFDLNPVNIIYRPGGGLQPIGSNQVITWAEVLARASRINVNEIINIYFDSTVINPCPITVSHDFLGRANFLSNSNDTVQINVQIEDGVVISNLSSIENINIFCQSITGSNLSFSSANSPGFTMKRNSFINNTADSLVPSLVVDDNELTLFISNDSYFHNGGNNLIPLIYLQNSGNLNIYYSNNTVNANNFNDSIGDDGTGVLNIFADSSITSVPTFSGLSGSINSTLYDLAKSVNYNDNVQLPIWGTSNVQDSFDYVKAHYAPAGSTGGFTAGNIFCSSIRNSGGYTGTTINATSLGCSSILNSGGYSGTSIGCSSINNLGGYTGFTISGTSFNGSSFLNSGGYTGTSVSCSSVLNSGGYTGTTINGTSLGCSSILNSGGYTGTSLACSSVLNSGGYTGLAGNFSSIGCSSILNSGGYTGISLNCSSLVNSGGYTGTTIFTTGVTSTGDVTQPRYSIRAYRNATQSCSASTVTAISWDTVETNGSGAINWTFTPPNSLFTCPKAGLYLINYSVMMAAAASGFLDTWVEVNPASGVPGSTRRYAESITPFTGFNFGHGNSFIYKLALSDTIVVAAFQSSVGALNIFGLTSNQVSSISIVRLSE